MGDLTSGRFDERHHMNIIIFHKVRYRCKSKLAPRSTARACHGET
jgi:hypothetical protein